MANPQYAILRFAKYKGPTLSRVEAHNERTKEAYASNPDIDTERSRLNFHPVKPKGKYREVSNRIIRESGCRVRKDSV
ncbi:MAG: plasmid recombination protein, partial [Lentisphaeria bacterium]|nr:plasmid recombination protein [Lentisphaeria bacterium]